MQTAFRIAALLGGLLLLFVGYIAIGMLSGGTGLNWIEPSLDERLRATAYQFSRGLPLQIGDGVTLDQVIPVDGGIQFQYTLLCWPDECTDSGVFRAFLDTAIRSNTCDSPHLSQLLVDEDVFVEVLLMDTNQDVRSTVRMDKSACESGA